VGRLANSGAGPLLERTSVLRQTPLAPRIGLLGRLSGLAKLLNHEIPRPLFHHGLDVQPLVAGRDDEAAGVLADALVLTEAQRKHLGAPQAGALAPKAGYRVLLAGPAASPDPVVDLAEDGLVSSDPLLGLIRHPPIISSWG
jgi:hypothetical protein